ncbi:uncharacterized protein LOC126847389 [Adelges cooleyi]|uniref:uncharacterized protein LOC126847389 n=1 Tax=Adelges cooleyi TaxID=133065 RepID=UPI00217F2F7F|nr:uncharacterized protein LOC126847389 [Adelges cooleyi]XP_050443526.1 uncharacterized protein LOC126847389 [Adelges cooleyi]XP_050443528.1 uncharacterized protein LOC126847389 [Adelges cooleyi]XP_050443529.1 uncharacterized protein LOC126847389 [Adelges cooleyi]XP_050443530.1 uncharacterized protein LOC126847389 [Adelges cooleyi]
MSSDENDVEGQFMKTYGILKAEEIIAVNDRRKAMTQKIALGLATREELIQQITTESNLLELCQKKISQELNEINNDHGILGIISNRINHMYNNLFLLFSATNNNLKDYIEFCMNNNLLDLCSQLLRTLMTGSHSDPEIYMTAARFEFDERTDIEQARKYYEQGRKEHSHYKKLYLDEVGMEIQHHEGGANNYDLCIEKYRAAINHFKGDITFHMQVLNSSLIHRSVHRIHSLIVCDMVETYKHNELLWHNLAQLQLRGYSYNPQTQRLSFSKEFMAVHNCINIYEDVLKQNILQINKQHLWELYLDTVIEIRESYRMQNKSTKKYMHETLERAFQNAHISGALLLPKYYLYWAENSSPNDRRAILTGAVKALKKSLELWTELLNLYITHDCFEKLIEVFQEGVRELRDDSLPLWEIVIRYMLNTHPKLVEQLYNEGSRVSYKVIALEMRPSYLDWCVLQKGIFAARELFEDLKNLEPPCQSLYMTMINCEKAQTNDVSKIKTIRKLYNDACNKFGKIDIEIWIECIRFEYMFGNRLLVDEIYKASLLCLEDDNINIMKSKFNAIKSEYKDDLPDIIVIDD